MPQQLNFLMILLDLGFKMAFEGGLSFNLGDIIIPEEKRNSSKKQRKYSRNY